MALADFAKTLCNVKFNREVLILTEDGIEKTTEFALSVKRIEEEIAPLFKRIDEDFIEKLHKQQGRKYKDDNVWDWKKYEGPAIPTPEPDPLPWVPFYPTPIEPYPNPRKPLFEDYITYTSDSTNAEENQQIVWDVSHQLQGLTYSTQSLGLLYSDSTS